MLSKNMLPSTMLPSTRLPATMSSIMLPSTMLPKQNYALMESKVYAERNGQVIKDKYIKETIANNKMEVEGYDNGKPIYYVKDLNKYMNNKLMPKKTSRKTKVKKIKSQYKTSRKSGRRLR